MPQLTVRSGYPDDEPDQCSAWTSHRAAQAAAAAPAAMRSCHAARSRRQPGTRNRAPSISGPAL